MAQTADDFNRKRLRSSNITVVVSIALVLFLLGLMGLILINAQRYSDYVKEQLVVSVFFDENYSTKDAGKLSRLEQSALNTIQGFPFVKNARYISRDKAAEEARKSMGIESDALFDKNIFPSSVEVSLRSNYVSPEKIEEIIKQLASVSGVREVKNNSKVMFEIYDSLDRILKWILGFSVLFLVLAIVLINNSIRLKIFSKRFIIKTMQLVGAKRRFILKPFIGEAVLLGFLGSLLALLALFGLWYYFMKEIGQDIYQEDIRYILLVLLVFLVGIFITVFSTVIATWRFLSSCEEDLYYS
ncbi:MAG: FtsX-like permease family protein [Bergeyella sp.]|nr:FtsX-like permease family protein [Bergeyella sp.]